MRRWIFAVFLMTVTSGAAIAQSLEIQGTISRQIEAFRTDDFGTAFSYASPNIQEMFRNAENFGRMVRQGYPMVWRPADVRFLELKQLGAFQLQKVMVKDGNGRFHVLEYEMVQTGIGWQINGVRLLPAAELGA